MNIITLNYFFFSTLQQYVKILFGFDSSGVNR